MSEEHDDEFDDSRCLEGGGHVRRIRFQDCVHPVVLGVVVYGAAAAASHWVCGLLRGVAAAGRALGDHAGQRPATCEFFFDIRHRSVRVDYEWTDEAPRRICV